MSLLVDLGRRLLHHWPRKLGALVAAVVVWLLVTNDPSVTAQRSLLVPLVVEGLAADRVAVGLPEFVEVTVTGESGRVDRLRPESFDAVLDLRDAVGAFQVLVLVAPPQGIALQRVVPSEVIGTIEAVTTVVVQVRVSVAGALDADERLVASADPTQAEVRGRAALVAQVAAVVAPVAVEDARTAGALTVPPYAVDGDGRPVPEVTVAPAEVRVDLAVEAVRVERRVPLAVRAPAATGWGDLRTVPEDVLVTGPASVLDALAEIDAAVDLPTETPAGGRYTRPLTLALPAGVFALEAPTVSALFVPSTLGE